jgi:hypothetical protein
MGIILFLLIMKHNNNLIEGLNTFNGRMAVDDQYFYDKMFDDVMYYPNLYDKDYKTGEEIGELISTGWQRCKSSCPSHCVEFGVTGNAYCFPY